MAEEENLEWTDELLNVSYSNLRVYEDKETLCFLGNNPMLTECEIAEKSAAFLAFSSSNDETNPRERKPSNLKTIDVVLKRKIGKKAFIIDHSLLSNNENIDPNIMYAKNSEHTKNDCDLNIEYSYIYDGMNSNRIIVKSETNSLRRLKDSKYKSDKNASEKVQNIKPGQLSLSSTIIRADISDISAHSCNECSFILRSPRTSMIITESLQSVLTFTQYTISDKIVFEWVRGVCLSGWLTKISKNPSRIIKQVKRFFTLENHILRWYKSEPTERDWVPASKKKDYSEMRLTPDTCITVEDAVGGMRTMTIRSPSKAIVLKVLENYMDDAVRWFQEIKRAIYQVHSMSLLKAKNRVETTWVHSNAAAAMVADDSFVQGSRNIGISLVRIPVVEEDSMNTYKGKKFGVKLLSSTPKSKTLKEYNYVLNIRTEKDQKSFPMQVLTLNESKSFRVSLECMKIFGENIILGGSCGFIGIGVLGKGTGIRGNWAAAHRKVLYCVGLESKSMQMSRSSDSSDDHSRSGRTQQHPDKHYPHSDSVTVVSIAICRSTKHTFAAIDDAGILSFWRLPMDDFSKSEEDIIEYWNASSSAEEKLQNIAKCYKVRPQLLSSFQLPHVMVPGEKIIKINFSPDDAYLTVSSNRRILMLSMQPCGFDTAIIDLEDDRSTAAAGQMRVYGWAEMDSTGSSHNDVVGHFAFQFFEKQDAKVQRSLEKQETATGSLFTQRQKAAPKIIGVLWKITECNETVLQDDESPGEMKISYGPFKNSYLEELEFKNCRITRQLWTDELFQWALRKTRN